MFFAHSAPFLFFWFGMMMTVAGAALVGSACRRVLEARKTVRAR